MSEETITYKEYKLLAAHMCHWGQGIKIAREECGIDPSLEDNDVLWDLVKCGYYYDRKADTLIWNTDECGNEIHCRDEDEE